MNGKKGALTLTISLVIKMILSVAVFFLMFMLFSALWTLLFSSGAKEDATAENVLEELAALINAQKGDEWTTKTFIKFPSDDYAIVGFSEGRTAFPNEDGPFKIPLRHKTGSELCLFDYSDENRPKVMACEHLKKIENIGGKYIYITEEEYAEQFFYSPRRESRHKERNRDTCMHEMLFTESILSIYRIGKNECAKST